VLGTFALVRLCNNVLSDDDKLKALKHSVGITAGLCILFLLFKSTLFDFEGIRDGDYAQAYGEPFVDALIRDRKALFTTDTFRSLILVLLSAGTIYFFIKKKLSEHIMIVIFAGLILFDLVSINKDYVNDDKFISAIKVDKPYEATTVDQEIIEDTSHFRVFDMSTQGQQQPARAAYFHNSLLGYHAAKLGRYNELLEFHVYKNNMNVLNMLNTKYLILEDKNQIFPYENKDTNGNAWFISKLRDANSANNEIKALDSINTKTTAVYSTTNSVEGKHSKLKSTYVLDSLASIKLIDYKPNYLKYASKNTNDGFAVFSEVYYANGWQAYIDNTPVTHHRVNYVLRGLNIPKGNHTIEFKFEPKVVQTGGTIMLGSTILFVLLFIGGLYYKLRDIKDIEDVSNA